jgi:prophage regulatory protein
MSRTYSRPKVAAKKIGVGLSTLWDKAANDPTFPKPFKPSPKVTLFADDLLEKWVEQDREPPR